METTKSTYYKKQKLYQDSEIESIRDLIIMIFKGENKFNDLYQAHNALIGIGCDIEILPRGYCEFSRRSLRGNNDLVVSHETDLS